jgi:two-component system cell cycle sensor histidine kinase/response regulator CckA
MQKILIVEDDENARTAIDTFFRDRGFSVKSAAGAAEAIELGESFAPTVLISDWMLGSNGDGVSVAKRLFRTNSQLTIIFVSGYSLDQLRIQCRDIAVSHFLEKPVSLAKLGAIVDHIVTKTC